MSGLHWMVQEVALEVGGRTCQQVMHHWRFRMAEAKAKGPWTPDEDTALLKVTPSGPWSYDSWS